MLELQRKKVLTLMLLPKATRSTTLMDESMRAVRPLQLRAEPIVTASRIDILLPMFIFPKTLTPEPTRAWYLTLMLDPKFSKSRTEQADDRRANDLKLKLLPI
jgi:hypothetical protein